MARMTRRFVTLACMLSLLIGLVTSVLWVRSYWRCDEWMWVGRPGIFTVVSRPGRLILHGDDEDHLTIDQPPLAPGFAHRVADPKTAVQSPVESDPDWRLAGFAWTHFKSDDFLGTHVWGLQIPQPALVCGFLVLPMAVVLKRFRRDKYRRQKGLCIYCGYDLRASVERCPECGRAVTCGSANEARRGGSLLE